MNQCGSSLLILQFQMVPDEIGKHLQTCGEDQYFALLANIVLTTCHSICRPILIVSLTMFIDIFASLARRREESSVCRIIWILPEIKLIRSANYRCQFFSTTSTSNTLINVPLIITIYFISLKLKATYFPY